MKAENKYIVSVVVPTYKRPALLIRCLAALMSQDFDATAYEVIIADDAACDETRGIVESWCEDKAVGLNLTLIGHCLACEQDGSTTFRMKCRGAMNCAHERCPYPGPVVRYLPVTGTHGPAAARNAGWRAARGEIIAFTDDDCVPMPGWLRAGVAAFTGDVAGVYGQLIVPLQHIPTDYERNAAQLATSMFVTANCFYRRACLAAIGGFDERFTAAWREDSDLLFALMKHYNTFVHAPTAIVVHPLRPAKWGVSLGQQRKSMFNALLYKKHPELYRQKIQATPPWRYYAIVGTLLALIGALLGRKPHVAFVAACLWTFMTGHFCLQRLEQTSGDRRHVAEMLVTSVLIPPLAIFWRIHGAIKFRVFFL